MNNNMTEPIRTIQQKFTYPTMNYANLFAYLFEEEEKIMVIKHSRYYNKDKIDIKKFYGFEKQYKWIKENIQYNFCLLLEDDTNAINQWIYGEEERENREDPDETLIGTLNFAEIRKDVVRNQEYWVVDFSDDHNCNVWTLFDNMSEIEYTRNMDWHEYLDTTYYTDHQFERYITHLTMFILDDLEDKHTEYLVKLRNKAKITIAEWFKEQYYSPYTKIGIKRFNKEREELFSE